MQTDTTKLKWRSSCLLYLIINKTQVQIEQKKRKYGIDYSLASASDGPCPYDRGPTLKMQFPHLRFPHLKTDYSFSVDADCSFERSPVSATPPPPGTVRIVEVEWSVLPSLIEFDSST